ncbi:MAG: hypothetical protein WED05_06030 [Candidatus Atabeyarchaeum deiterrae]
MSVDFSSKYLIACLRLGRHVNDLVDSYYGPMELIEKVDKEHSRPLGEIFLDFEELKKEIVSAQIDEMRKTFLLKQVKALQATTREKMGVTAPYREYVSSTLDIEPKDVKEQEISELRTQLETLLKKKGYHGNLTEMLLESKKKRLISGERLVDLFYNLLTEARYETMKSFNLPAGERVELSILKDRPWTSDNRYLGNYKSLVELNIQMPVTSSSLPLHVTHQSYPGHHTEHVLKEMELYLGKKQLESSILLVNTPECTMSEGLAETSRKFILGEPSMAEDRIEDLEMKFRRAVRVNTALMVYDKRLDLEQTKEYFTEEGAYEKKESELGMRFVLDPLLRAYLFTYYEGERLISDAWKRAKEAGKIEQLLQILYREENCPTTFKEKVEKLFK